MPINQGELGFGGIFHGALRRTMAQPLLDLVEIAPISVGWIVSFFVGPIVHYIVALRPPFCLRTIAACFLWDERSAYPAGQDWLGFYWTKPAALEVPVAWRAVVLRTRPASKIPHHVVEFGGLEVLRVHLDYVNSAASVLVPLHILFLYLILGAAVESDGFSYGHALLQHDP
jgi:hypothetical protein